MQQTAPPGGDGEPLPPAAAAAAAPGGAGDDALPLPMEQSIEISGDGCVEHP